MRRDADVVVVLASAVPVLLVRLGVVFVRLKARRRRAVRAFHRALVRGGMSDPFARGLADDYAAYGRIRSYLPGRFKFRPFPLRSGRNA